MDPGTKREEQIKRQRVAGSRWGGFKTPGGGEKEKRGTSGEPGKGKSEH